MIPLTLRYNVDIIDDVPKNIIFGLNLDYCIFYLPYGFCCGFCDEFCYGIVKLWLLIIWFILDRSKLSNFEVRLSAICLYPWFLLGARINS